MEKAFVLGAGLGTRLRPLTARLPKPLVPVFHRPLIAYAFDHLQAAGVDAFAVNTHHCPEAYETFFPEQRHAGCPIEFRHEPVLLETAGGIWNVSDLFQEQLDTHGSFFVYNGDILTDLPLDRAAAQHRASGDAVTLILRSIGPSLHVGFDPNTNKATDIRDMLGTGEKGSHQFTGIYLVSKDFVDHLTPGKKESVIPHFLHFMREERVGAVVEDEGIWCDLGNRESYLDAHHELAGRDFPAYADNGQPNVLESVHADAKIAPSAQLDAFTVVGPGAEIGAGAKVLRSILWPDAKVSASAQLDRCVVRDGETAGGNLADSDI